jgi:hypothetical protein
VLLLKLNEKRCPRLGSWSTDGVGELVDVGVEDGDGLRVGEAVLVAVAEGTGVFFFFFLESEPQPATAARNARAAAKALIFLIVRCRMRADLVPDILLELPQGRALPAVIAQMSETPVYFADSRRHRRSREQARTAYEVGAAGTVRPGDPKKRSARFGARPRTLTWLESSQRALRSALNLQAVRSWQPVFRPTL